ncbi:MAG: hypothetical protein JOY96_07190 [Verrucomicrobia bacterium]|nr:hypothetical protein [Verrucomicrobiota bacterium]
MHTETTGEAYMRKLQECDNVVIKALVSLARRLGMDEGSVPKLSYDRIVTLLPLFLDPC